MRKVGITSAKVHVELDYYLKGSVKQGTVENKVTEVRSDFTVESKDCLLYTSPSPRDS